MLIHFSVTYWHVLLWMVCSLYSTITNSLGFGFPNGPWQIWVRALGFQLGLSPVWGATPRAHGYTVLPFLWSTGINYTLRGILLNHSFTKYVSYKSIKGLVRQLLIYWNNRVFTIWVLILTLAYLLNAIGLTPDGSSTVHIYTKQYRTTCNWEECRPFPVFAVFLRLNLPCNWGKSMEKT